LPFAFTFARIADGGSFWLQVARRMKRRPLATASVHASTDQAQASPNSKVVAAESSTAFLNVRRKSYDRTVSALEKGDADGSSAPLLPQDCDDPHDDRWNYALLLALYTLQGIPMGLSASIPFLIQQKVKVMAEHAASHVATDAASAAAGAAAAAHAHHPAVAKMAYNAQAIFALCSWPFSLKLLWAPIVDACFWRKFGRRKSWLVPVQALAGLLMVGGSDYVEKQLGLGTFIQDAATNAASALSSTASVAASTVADQTFDVKGLTCFFFALYFLMATQDIAVDGFALTILNKKNRGRGPVCNSIGQNFGYFLSFVGFLALNDPDSSEKLWRPLLRLPSRPGVGLVSLGGFIKFCGILTLSITTLVALFKKEEPLPKPTPNEQGFGQFRRKGSSVSYDEEEFHPIEIYRKLWAVCRLPAVQGLGLILLTYRLPTALSDNVKFLKATEYGMSKQTMALLSPTLILPLGILVPIVATNIWHGHPLRQFMSAYKLRVTLTPLFDVLMLLAVRYLRGNSDLSSQTLYWSAIIISTALQAIVHSLQFNAQMTFFAHRVDPAIGGSYMTLLNTLANLGGTWPASFAMLLVGQLTVPPDCVYDESAGRDICTGGRDAYFSLQLAFSILGCLWIFFLGKKVDHIAALPDDAWRTHLDDDKGDFREADAGNDGEPKKD